MRKDIIIGFSIISIFVFSILAFGFFGISEQSAIAGCQPKETGDGSIQFPDYAKILCLPVAGASPTQQQINLEDSSEGVWISPMDYGMSDEYEITIDFGDVGIFPDKYEIAICPTKQVTSACRISRRPDSKNLGDDFTFYVVSDYIYEDTVGWDDYIYVRSWNADYPNTKCLLFSALNDDCWEPKEGQWFKINYVPFTLWKEEASGKMTMIEGSSRCVFGYNEEIKVCEDGLCERVLSSTQIDTSDSVQESRDALYPYEVINYVSRWVSGIKDANIVSYKAGEYYCESGDLFRIHTVVTDRSGCVEYVDESDIAYRLDCCFGDETATMRCNSDFEWEAKTAEDQECDAFNPCPGNGLWIIDYEYDGEIGKQIMMSECVDGLCEYDFKEVECSYNGQCADGEVCTGHVCVSDDTPDVCNLNGICEASRGETDINCQDCMREETTVNLPLILSAVFGLLVAMIIGLVAFAKTKNTALTIAGLMGGIGSGIIVAIVSYRLMTLTFADILAYGITLWVGVLFAGILLIALLALAIRLGVFRK